VKITDEMLFAAAPKVRDLLLDSLPSDIPSQDVSAEFQQKMEKLHRKYTCIRLLKQTARVLRKTAAILLILLGITSAGILTAAAVQGKALDLMIYIYEEYIVYESPSYPGREVVYEELYPIKLGWLPYHMDIAFENLLKAGVDRDTAYRVLHLNEFMDSSMRYGAELAAKQIADSIRQKSARPSESALLGKGYIAKTSVSSLTPQKRRELAKKALMGEEIEF